jgi:uncharacterized protein YbaP (TraB family)
MSGANPTDLQRGDRTESNKIIDEKRMGMQRIPTKALWAILVVMLALPLLAAQTVQFKRGQRVYVVAMRPRARRPILGLESTPQDSSCHRLHFTRRSYFRP